MNSRLLILLLGLAPLAACGSRSDDFSFESATAAAQAQPVAPSPSAVVPGIPPSPPPPAERGSGLTPIANDDLRRMTPEQRQKEATKAEQAGDLERAEAAYRMNVEDYKSGDRKTWQYSSSIRSLAYFYHYKNMIEKAEPTFLAFIEAQKEVAGPEHAYVGGAILDYTGWLCYHQRFLESLPLFDQALAIFEKTTGASSPEVVKALKSKMGSLVRLERTEEAKAIEARIAQIESQFTPTPAP